MVSIHAPGRGATVKRGKGRPKGVGFNSRTREGCDRCTSTTKRPLLSFQFTHPGGVRRSLRRPAEDTKRFNSRTREGCDIIQMYALVICAVSIHAPGRGATNRRLASSTLNLFQFTHPGGVRPLSLNLFLEHNSFNSRTREGCDSAVQTGVDNSPTFQFTHPGGVRPTRASSFHQSFTFQFTHPGGVRQRLQGRHRRILEVSIHAPGRGATSCLLT